MMVIDYLLRTELHMANSSPCIASLSSIIVSLQSASSLGIMLDYSRENVQPVTMVRTSLFILIVVKSNYKALAISLASLVRYLFISNATNRKRQEYLMDLAGAAGLERKRAAMAAGEHINSTEDRAVMHIALRAPRTKKLIVDGADVVPDVHAVLSKVHRTHYKLLILDCES
jgi:Phosphoglucose isomerase